MSVFRRLGSVLAGVIGSGRIGAEDPPPADPARDDAHQPASSSSSTMSSWAAWSRRVRAGLRRADR